MLRVALALLLSLACGCTYMLRPEPQPRQRVGIYGPACTVVERPGSRLPYCGNAFLMDRNGWMTSAAVEQAPVGLTLDDLQCPCGPDSTWGSP